MKKKCFGLIIDINNLGHYIHAHELLITKISNHFEKFYVINVSNCKLTIFKNSFLSWDTFNDKDKSEVLKKLPKNFVFINPKNINELKTFFKNKDFLLINNIGRTFPELDLYFKLSSKKIRQIIISNIANNEAGLIVSPFSAKLKIIFGKKLPAKIISLLMIIGILKKFEIRFDSNRKMINAFKKQKKINRIYNKVIPVNNRSFDSFKLSKLKVAEDFIVLIDANLNHKEDVAARGKVDEKSLNHHYERLNNLLKKLQNFYQKKVIICIHPQYDLNETKKKFPNFETIKFKTKESIYNAFLVLFFDSTAIMDAFLLKKNIISLKSKIDWLGRPASYYTQYGTTLIDIDSDLNFSKKELDEKFRISKQYYNNFLYDYIITDGDKIGVDKVINYCKAVCDQLNE